MCPKSISVASKSGKEKQSDVRIAITYTRDKCKLDLQFKKRGEEFQSILCMELVKKRNIEVRTLNIIHNICFGERKTMLIGILGSEIAILGFYYGCTV